MRTVIVVCLVALALAWGGVGCLIAARAPDASPAVRAALLGETIAVVFLLTSVAFLLATTP